MDYCSFEGAQTLLNRIRAARAKHGEPCDLVVTCVANFSGKPVYGVRAIGAAWRRAPEVNGKRGCDNAQITAVCKRTLQSYPEISINLLVSGGRTIPLSRARRACIRACVDAGLAPSHDALARFFRLEKTAIRRALEATEPQQVAA